MSTSERAASTAMGTHPQLGRAMMHAPPSARPAHARPAGLRGCACPAPALEDAQRSVSGGRLPLSGLPTLSNSRRTVVAAACELLPSAHATSRHGMVGHTNRARHAAHPRPQLTLLARLPSAAGMCWSTTTRRARSRGRAAVTPSWRCRTRTTAWPSRTTGATRLAAASSTSMAHP